MRKRSLQNKNLAADVSVVDTEPANNQGTLFKEISDLYEADLFIFSGPIERPQASMFLDTVESNKSRKNVVLIICTHGGDADAAYIMARFLKANYDKFTLFVFGHCKSAGTLIALGSDEIVMSHRGELGPLDVQLLKTDELLFRGSGLDIGQAITSLSQQAFEIFETYFIDIIKKGGGAITTRTAAEIATHLSVGLISPITSQIDPLRVGEVERAIDIAYEYGTRLNVDAEKVDSLINDYPSHSFVIDYEEAKSLFRNVRRPTEGESKLEHVLQELVDDEGRKCVRHPHRRGMVAYLKPQKETKHEEPKQESSSKPDDGNRADAIAPNGIRSPGRPDVSEGDGAHPPRVAGEEPTAEQAESTHRVDGEKRRAAHRSS